METEILDNMIRAAHKAARVIKRDFAELSAIKRSRTEIQDFILRAEAKSYEVAMLELEETDIATTALVEDYGIVPMLNKNNNNTKLSITDYQFVIDPIDGTTNFMHANPNYSISIALRKIPKTTKTNDTALALNVDNIIFAVVHLPHHNETFVAIRDMGAYIIDTVSGIRKRIHVSEERDLGMSLVGTNMHNSDCATYQRAMALFKNNKSKIRMSGSVSIDCVFLAMGRLNIICFGEANSWDCAAGLLIAHEAGAVIKDLNFKKITSLQLGIIGANSHLLGKVEKACNDDSHQ